MLTYSIIIPVYNDAERLKKVIQAIRSQTISLKGVEIIVVDNGSTQDIKSICEQNETVYILENRYLNSPYSCRNRGIEVSKGDVIVLLDATCVPDQAWLIEATKELEDADIVGGNVQFELTSKSTSAEFVDALTSVRMKWSIENRKSAYTANLFVKKKWFDKIGSFPEGLRSGGDVRWTKSATQSGAKIVFCEKAVVLKEARDFNSLKKKKWRTSKNQTLNWISEGKNVPLKRYLVVLLKLILIPPMPGSLKLELLSYSGVNFTSIQRLKIWGMHYYIRVLEGIGIIYGGIFLNKKILDKKNEF